MFEYFILKSAYRSKKRSCSGSKVGVVNLGLNCLLLNSQISKLQNTFHYMHFKAATCHLRKQVPMVPRCKANCELWIVNCKLWIVNCELWIVNSEFWILNSEFWIVNCELVKFSFSIVVIIVIVIVMWTVLGCFA